MPVFRSAWLLPISQPPIRDGWVRTDRGRIVAFGRARAGFAANEAIDLGDVIVLPGLVNAHTHLELSWMCGRIPPAGSFPEWIRAVIALRAQTAPNDEEIVRSIAAAIDDARRCGTALIGDVSNTLASSAILMGRDMPALVFHELLGFEAARAQAVVEAGRRALSTVRDSDQLRHALSPHAPYSVSPALFGAIRDILDRNPSARSTVHLGESQAEIDFLLDGSGPFRELLTDLGVWDPSWVAPECGAVEYLARMGLLDERMLVVHGVQFREADLQRLAFHGATVVSCPRGNRLTGAGRPPAAAFFHSGVRVAVGTDSLASVPDLNLFAELAELRRLAPHVPASRLLESATVQGARALGFDADFGAIEAGKRDRLIAVDVGRREADVEEYLVSGIAASQIRWL